jgi:hypothetical protein
MMQLYQVADSLKYICPIADFRNIALSPIPKKVYYNYSLNLKTLVNLCKTDYFKIQDVLQLYFTQGIGKDLTQEEKNNIRRQTFKIWTIEDIARRKEEWNVDKQKLIFPPCASCGSGDHGFLDIKENEQGKEERKYACPHTLCDDWNMKLKTKGPTLYKWTPCPLKVSKHLTYNISQVDKLCDNFERKGVGQKLTSNGKSMFRKECYAECHKQQNRVKRKELTLIFIIFCISMILLGLTHATLELNTTNIQDFSS